VVTPLAPIAAHLRAGGHRVLVCDGTAPGGSTLPLKLAAVRAGLGWQGKHALLISKTFGSFMALGGLITDADLEFNTRPEPNRCRSCNLCREACPLRALERPHVLTMERCLSYQLQEEALSPEAKAIMGNRVGDCEICQTACPWNRRHIMKPLQTKLTVDFQKRISAWERFFHLPELVQISEAEYGSRLGPLNTEIPYAYFHRNVRLAMANTAGKGCG